MTLDSTFLEHYSIKMWTYLILILCMVLDSLYKLTLQARQCTFYPPPPPSWHAEHPNWPHSIFAKYRCCALIAVPWPCPLTPGRPPDPPPQPSVLLFNLWRTLLWTYILLVGRCSRNQPRYSFDSHLSYDGTDGADLPSRAEVAVSDVRSTDLRDDSSRITNSRLEGPWRPNISNHWIMLIYFV